MDQLYKKAPLPFLGQKRRFVDEYSAVIKSLKDISIVVDLFGGSGLLSHVAKRMRPDLTVIYNDFDNFTSRLKNIRNTCALLDTIRLIVKDYPKKKRLPESMKTDILAVLEDEEKTGFVDYETISSSLLFTTHYVTNLNDLKKSIFFNNVVTTKYHATGYTDGLQITRMDYRKLYSEYASRPDVLFVFDPPYLSTLNGHYHNSWTLGDYLDVVDLLYDSRFIFFTSDRTYLPALLHWLEASKGFPDPLRCAKKICKVTRSYSLNYTDIMFVQSEPGKSI